MPESSVRRCWLALPQAKVSQAEGTLVDIETETHSGTTISWEWILLLKLLITEKILRSVSEI